MRHEKFDAYAPFVPLPPIRIQSQDAALAELRQPCGRFAPLLTTEDQLRSFITEKLASVDPLREKFVFSEGTPLNWQRLLAYLYDEKIIPSPQFSFRHLENDRPHLFDTKLDSLRDPTVTDGRIEAFSGFGVSFDIEESMSKAVGETLERHFLASYKYGSMLQKSYAELKAYGESVLEIKHLNSFLPWQRNKYPAFRCGDDSQLHWTVGENFVTKEKVYIPAQLTFWNYSRKQTAKDNYEPFVAGATTSGCAGHFSKDEAVLAALLEAIQRDGFVIYWLNSLSPKRINVDELTDPGLRHILDTLERYQLKAAFLNTTSDIGIPSVTCVIIDKCHRDGPIISIGSDAGFNLVKILKQSALEACVVNGFAATLKTYPVTDTYQPFTDFKLLRHERLSAWKGLQMYERFKFFLAGDEQGTEAFMRGAPQSGGYKEQLVFLLEKLAAMGPGYEVYVHEVSHHVLQKLGYHVVRVIVPQLFPLYLNEGLATLDSKRLREVPSRIGYKAAEKLNPWPHPFP